MRQYPYHLLLKPIAKEKEPSSKEKDLLQKSLSPLEEEETKTFNTPMFFQVKRTKELYGDNQELYNRFAYETVCMAAKKLAIVKEKRKVTEEDFDEHINFLAERRRLLAEITRSEDHHLYGSQRKKLQASVANGNSKNYFTPLDTEQYGPFQLALKSIFLTFLKKNIGKNTGLQKSELGNSRFTIELIPFNSPDFKDRIEKFKNLF